MLKRYGIDGEFVRFDDLIELVNDLSMVAEGFDSAGNSERNKVFNNYPDEVWDAVIDRDFDIAAEIWNMFITEYNLTDKWLKKPTRKEFRSGR